MGALLETMSPQKLDIQREVVKNERRQSYENVPYGMFWETAYRELYPQGHPYSWTTIGSMEDLSAASLEDVEEFFRTYYVPNNAVLAISGDVDARWWSGTSAGSRAAPTWRVRRSRFRPSRPAAP
jgi:zinc protease